MLDSPDLKRNTQQSPSVREELNDDDEEYIDPAKNPRIKLSKLPEGLREFREDIIIQVDNLLERQGHLDPIAKMESFEVETSSRKVLKELIETYVDIQDKQNKKISQLQQEQVSTKSKIGQIEQLMKKTRETAEASLTLQKRVNMLEEQQRAGKDLVEKKHENLKEMIKQGDQMLEHRIEAFENIEDKVNLLTTQLQKNHGMHEDYKKSILEEIGRINSEHAFTKGDLAKHMNEYKSVFLNNEFFMDKCNNELKKFEKKVDSLRIYLDSKVEQVQFDCSRRVRIDDMKQNFKQLQDILVVKFRQLEDTKEATRNLITYIKFFHQINTQQLISENLMQLKMAREDQGFIDFQKQIFDDFNERTRLECKMAAKIFDYDLKAHLEQLEAHHIKGNDFQPFALKDVQLDLMKDLLYRYLQDIKHRQKAGEFGRATASTLLRKCVKLDDIEVMIEDLQRKSNDLLSQAEKHALKIAEEQRIKALQENVNKLVNKKVDFRIKDLKRNKSHSGGLMKPMLQGFDFEEWDHEVNLKKSGSPVQKREDAIRVTQYHNMGQVVPQSDSDSQSDQAQAQDKEEDDLIPKAGDGSTTMQVPANMQQFMAMFQAMSGKEGAEGATMPFPMFDMGPQSKSMDRQEKRKLMNDIKEEMKILITQISDYQVEQAVTIVKTQLRKLEQENELDKKRIVQRFEKELQNLTEYFKKSVQDVKSEFSEDIKQIERKRSRDKSDNDLKFTDHGTKLETLSEHQLNHQEYFGAIAKIISIITENLNMQMETENSDTLDRQLTALYGVHPSHPNRMQFYGRETMNHTELDRKDAHAMAKTKASKKKGAEAQANQAQLNSLSKTQSNSNKDQLSQPDVDLDEESSEEDTLSSVSRTEEAKSVKPKKQVGNKKQQQRAQPKKASEVSIDKFLDQDIKMTGKSKQGGNQTSHVTLDVNASQKALRAPLVEADFENALYRKPLPITMDHNCMQHTSNGRDAEITLKLFKLACLTYKPSKVTYRGITMSREEMIRVRRGFIDRIENILPTCDLFKTNAIYPKRYFDDLMMETTRKQFQMQRQANQSAITMQNRPGQLSPITQQMGLSLLSPTAMQTQMNSIENSARFLPELSPPSAQNLFGFGNPPMLFGKQQQDFQSNPSMNDKTTATGHDFFGYHARKKKIDQFNLKRDLNMSMTIDTSNNTLRDGIQMRVSPSKQEFHPLMPIVQGLHTNKAKHRYGQQSLAGGIRLNPNLYSSIQLQPGQMNRFKSKVINDTESLPGKYSTSVDNHYFETNDHSQNILTNQGSKEGLIIKKNLINKQQQPFKVDGLNNKAYLGKNIASTSLSSIQNNAYEE